MRKHAIPIVLALAVVAGCAQSNTALRRHSIAAETLEDMAVQSREAVRKFREAELRRVGAAAQEAGADFDSAVREASKEFDRTVVSAVNTFINAKRLYVRAVLQAARKDSPTFGDLRDILRPAVAAYESLRKAVGDRISLPAIPDIIKELI